jgi:hypothetical protein
VTRSDFAPGSSALVYDVKLKRPASVLLQATLGGDRDALLRLWPSEAWLNGWTDDMRLVVCTDGNWKNLARPWTRVIVRTCEWCGKRLGTNRQRFCSSLCNTKTWRAANRDKYRKAQEANYYRHHDKSVARYQVKLALLDGRIHRPAICSRCNAPAKYIEAHHWLGYEEPHWLDVIWLCKRCHGLEHRKASAA